MLGDVEESSCLQDEESKELLLRKKRIMTERLENLKQRNWMGILRQYRKNRKEIRLATVVCDLVICGQREV